MKLADGSVWLLLKEVNGVKVWVPASEPKIPPPPEKPPDIRKKWTWTDQAKGTALGVGLFVLAWIYFNL